MSTAPATAYPSEFSDFPADSSSPASFQCPLFLFPLFTEGLEPVAMAIQSQLLGWITCCLAAPQVSTSRKCIVALEDLPRVIYITDFNHMRLHSQQLAGWPSFYMKQWLLALHAEAFECHSQHRQAS